MGLITLKRHFWKKNDSHIARNPCTSYRNSDSCQRRERFLMPTTTTMMATRRGTRSKFEAEDGDATKLAAENSKAFIHASNSFLHVSYTSAVAVASAAAAAAARTKKLPKRTKERNAARDRKRQGEKGRDESAQPNIIIQRAEKRRFRVEISWGAKLKLVFVHYSFARLRRRPN